MTIKLMLRKSLSGVIFIVTLAALSTLQAFPPAPLHTVFGIVRDQVGNPLAGGAEVILESPGGASVRAFVATRLESSTNYELRIPMDAGLIDKKYHPTALLPASPFRLRVKVGKTSYLPMEMTGDLTKLGDPAGRTRIDLTLGVDSDGNGLPDAWEKSASALLGNRWEAGKIKADDMYPGTGMTYREVYVAGTYAVSPKEGFALTIVSGKAEAPRLSFTAVKGRAYKVQACAVLGEWSPVPFVVLPANAAARPLTSYHADQTRKVDIEIPSPSGAPHGFFRLLVE